MTAGHMCNPHWLVGEGGTPTKEEYIDLGKEWDDRQAAGWSPEVAVMAAEKNYFVT